MASKKKNTVRKAKPAKAAMTPAVRYLRYRLANGDAGVETSHYLDIAKDLSALNRRLMRQGRVYHIKKISVVSTNTIAGWTGQTLPNPNEQQNAGFITVSTIPDSWSARAAWNRGFSLWNEMNKDAKNATNSISGTWADFKVGISRDGIVATKPYPYDNGNNEVLNGEWNYSEYVGPVSGGGTPDTYGIHMLGAHSGAAGVYNSIGLIQSFGDARATVNSGSPDVPSGASLDPLVNLFDYGDTINTIIDVLEGENDSPPYDQFEYPGDGDNTPKPLVVQHAAISNGQCTLGSFTAICGLLEIEMASPIAGDLYSVLVEVAPGSYRGVKAERI